MNNAAPLDPAIARHRTGLLGVLALIFVYIRLADDASDAKEMLDGKAPETAAARAFRFLGDEPCALLRSTHRRIRKLLLPAESAARRLIVALAADLPPPKLSPSEIKRISAPLAPKPAQVQQTHNSSVRAPRLVIQRQNQKRPKPGPPKHMPRFSLLDQRKHFGRKRKPKRTSEPRIISLYADRLPPSTHKPPQTDADQVSPVPLLRRIAALTAALNDLPAQAQRLARWKARRDVRLAACGDDVRRSFSIRREPLRPGRPPGSPPLRLPNNYHHLDQHIVLAGCAKLAWWATNKHYYQRRDTS